MFCENCGKQLPDDSAFCDGCGAKMTPVENVQPQAAGASYAAPAGAVAEKKPFVLTKQHKIIGLAGIGVILLAIIIAIIVSIASKNIKLDKYVTITAKGYEGYGSVEYEVDYAALFERITGEDVTKYESLEDLESLKNAAEIMAKAAVLDSAITIDVTYPEDRASTKLCNGDVVVFDMSFSESAAKELGVKVKPVTVEYEIKDLGEAATFDVLSYFDIKFTGYSGVGKAEIVPKDATKTVGNITFEVSTDNGAKVKYEGNGDDYAYGSYYIEFEEYYYNLSNGDTVKVYVSGASEDSLQTSGVILKGLTKEITVEGLEEAASYDVLSNISVEFSGVEGDGNAKIAAKDSTTTVGNITFTTSADDPKYVRWEEVDNSRNYGSFYISFDTKSSDLSTGDKVTVECTYSADYLIEYGVMLTGLTKEVEVTGLGAYATSLKSISKDTLAAVAADCKEDLMNRLYDDWGDTVHNSWRTYKNQKISEDMAVYKTIMTTPKNTSSSTHSNLFVVFSVTLQDDSMDAATKYYFYYNIKNIVVNAAGEAEFDMKYGTTKSYGYTDYNKLYTDKIESFNVNIETAE